MKEHNKFIILSPEPSVAKRSRTFTWEDLGIPLKYRRPMNALISGTVVGLAFISC